MAIHSEFEIKYAVQESVKKVMKVFQEAPYSFLYESDLQAVLCAELRSRLTIPLKIKKSNSSEETYALQIVQTEYKDRIDVACLDPEASQSRKTEPHKSFDTYIYNLPVLVGIEIKYLKMGDGFDFVECHKDFSKMCRSEVKYFLVLGFIQDEKNLQRFISRAAEAYTPIEKSDAIEFDHIYIVSPKSQRIFKSINF